MTVSKRELVLKTLEREETDIIPIHCLGFEKSCTAYGAFVESDIADELCTIVPSVGDITEQRFWSADTWVMDPFDKIRAPRIEPPPEYPEYTLDFKGRLFKTVTRPNGTKYRWFIGPYFTKKETLLEYWSRYGKPSEYLNHSGISAEVWSKYVEALSPYFYPIASLPVPLWESIFEGIGPARVAYYMRKDPEFIEFVLEEYTRLNLEAIKAMDGAGVEIVMLYDDLGQKNRTLISPRNFRRFLLPYYRRIYGEVKKRSMFIVHHSCGNITDFLGDLADAGLDCIQALEPAAGVDLGYLKEKYGDKLAFMGGMDSTRVLNFGTPEEIVEEVIRCIRAAAPGGGYFAGPSHNILDVPFGNVCVFRDALIKYSRNPSSVLKNK